MIFGDPCIYVFSFLTSLLFIILSGERVFTRLFLGSKMSSHFTHYQPDSIIYGFVMLPSPEAYSVPVVIETDGRTP